MSSSTLEFLIPKLIKEGIDQEQYEVIGGIIRRVDDGTIVLWLDKHANWENRVCADLDTATEVVKIAITAPFDMGTTLVFTTFSFMASVFYEKNKSLNELSFKIDNANLSKLEAGIELAKDAELIKEKYQAIQQIVNSRQSIKEGRIYFINTLIETLRKKRLQKLKGNDLQKLLSIITIGMVAEARTYLWTSDYLDAKNCLLRLRLLILELRIYLLKLLKDSFLPQSLLVKNLILIGTTISLMISWPATVTIFAMAAVYEKYKTIEEVEFDVRNLLVKIQNKESKAKDLEGLISKLETKYPYIHSSEKQQIQQLKLIEKFIEAYIEEIIFMEKNSVEITAESLHQLPICHPV